MITSARNPQIAKVRRLARTRERRTAGLTTVEGPILLEEAVNAGVVVQTVLAVPGDQDAMRISSAAALTVTLVAPEVLKAVADSVNPRGPVAVVEIPKTPEIQPVDSIVLWRISDPGNAGTIIRSAAAFGFQVLATEGTVDLWAPKVVRSAAGGHFRRLPIEGLEAHPDRFSEVGLYPLVAAASASKRAEDQLRRAGPVAVIVGNEAHGVSEDFVAPSGVNAMSLAMPGGVESLNVGVASAILMYLRLSARQ